MRAPFDIKTSLASLPTAQGKAEPIVNADSALSAALRGALGSGHDAAHGPGRFVKTGQDIAKRAKAEKPSLRNAVPHQGHIGPRSGHK
jgi:hypothetical protein